jgi:hypothetical protein
VKLSVPNLLPLIGQQNQLPHPIDQAQSRHPAAISEGGGYQIIPFDQNFLRLGKKIGLQFKDCFPRHCQSFIIFGIFQSGELFITDFQPESISQRYFLVIYAANLLCSGNFNGWRFLQLFRGQPGWRLNW